MKKQGLSQTEFEQIERYLNGSMRKDEQSGFEKSLNENAGLKQKVEETRILFQAVEEQSLRNKLNTFHKEVGGETPMVSPLHSFRRYAIAASIALLAALSIWLVMNQKPKNEKLFAQYFKPDPGLITPMSSTSDYEFYRGMVDYKQEKYKLAIDRWTSIIDQKPNNDTLNFYMGLSRLSEGNAVTALPFLEKVPQTPKSIFLPDVYFFIGLAYLKKGNIEDAKTALKKNGSKKARELLDELSE